MKKKTSIFFALLFVATMAFGFGMATTAQAGPDNCCDYGIPFPGCQQSRGHWVEIQGLVYCKQTFTDPCDFTGTCQ